MTEQELYFEHCSFTIDQIFKLNYKRLLNGEPLIIIPLERMQEYYHKQNKIIVE